MKILLLADSNSSHTIKWATSLAEKDFEIIIFSFTENVTDIYKKYKSIIIESAGIPRIKQFNTELHFSKVIYFSAIPAVKRIIKKYKPDILHAHYASSYGLLGAITSFHPFIVSVWGSDVFDFPKKSFLHKVIMKYIFRKADKILSTSNIMATETNLYTQKKIEVTPFGVDTEKFQPRKSINLFRNEAIVIGTVKTLEKKYGILFLLKSFANVKSKHPELPLKLLIVGGGTEEKQLKALAVRLKISGETIFTGKINHDEVNKYHSQFSIAVFPSINDSESFGVSVLEASACEVPVVASKIGGVPEVVQDGITGILVSPKDEMVLAEAIEKLVLNADLRSKMGKAGRKFVQQNYELKSSVAKMTIQYREILGIN